MSTHGQAWDRLQASSVCPLVNRLRDDMVDRPDVNLSSIIYRVSRLRMSGAMYLLPLYDFMAWTCQHYVFLEKRVPA
jgi:hypothetical protein